MASSSTLIGELSKMLQCAICLETVTNPKILNCSHSYCKLCLDNLLKFTPNGSASIKCPQGCASLTKLSCKETTNDLGDNYMLKDILEVMRMEKKGDENTSKVTCGACTRDIKNYCTQCKQYRCERCPDEHRDMENAFIPVEYRLEQDKVVIVCTEHSTEARYACCESKFICLFCVHRGHRRHLYETERSFKCHVAEELYKRGNDNKKQTEMKNHIVDVKRALEKELMAKKLKCLSEYSDFLDEEEKSIKSEFDVLSMEHSTSFNSVAFLQECLSKEGTQFFLQRNDILSKLKDMDDDKTSTCMTVSLTDSKFNDEHPFGSLSAAFETLKDNEEKCFRSGITTVDINRLIPSLQSLKETLDQQLNTEMIGQKRKLSSCPPNSGLSFENAIGMKIFESDSQAAGVINFTVKNVSNLSGGTGVNSHPVMIRNLPWLLQFVPKESHKRMRKGGLAKGGAVFLYCALDGFSYSCQVQVTFRLYNYQGNHYIRSITRNFSAQLSCSGFNPLVHWDDIIDPTKGYINNNSIVIQAVVSAKIPVFNAAHNM